MVELVITIFLALALALAVALLCWRIVHMKALDIWIPGYLEQKSRRKRISTGSELIHVIFCFVDHFEPMWNGANYQQECDRVARWVDKYERLASSHTDIDGCFPKHTFFYPEEEYREEHLSHLANLCAGGFGEIEVHLHHDNDTERGLRAKVTGFLETLDKAHGAVARHRATGSRGFCFIHGNWALDNSRPDGRCCGIDNELEILTRLGCYADFTLPSAPSRTQTRKVNSIYYPGGNPHKAKSHNTGTDCVVGDTRSGELLLIQGPLSLNWLERKWGLLPKLENGDIRASMPPTSSRVDNWVRQKIHVLGRPEWVFVKIHTHGAQESDMSVLLGTEMDQMFRYLESSYNDGKQFALHYVSAREAYNIAKAAEAGERGNPANFRDFVFLPPDFGRTKRAREETK